MLVLILNFNLDYLFSSSRSPFVEGTIICAHFRDKKTKVQGDDLTCPQLATGKQQGWPSSPGSGTAELPHEPPHLVPSQNVQDWFFQIKGRALDRGHLGWTYSLLAFSFSVLTVLESILGTLQGANPSLSFVLWLRLHLCMAVSGLAAS